MLSGAGMWIWNLSNTEGGDPVSIVRAAQDAKLTHVLIKICDGIYGFNVLPSLVTLVNLLAGAGITPIGWGYVYGEYPEKEADIAARRMTELGLSWFVIDAETEYKHRTSQAVTYANRLRSLMPSATLGLSSFRFPTLHREFPFKEFLARVDVILPQVYWVGEKNSGSQLLRCIDEYDALSEKPIIPTGAAYVDNTTVDPETQAYWRPTVDQVEQFMETCKDAGIDAFNFWVWENTWKHCPDLWDAIKKFSYPHPDNPHPDPLPEGDGEGNEGEGEGDEKVRPLLERTVNVMEVTGEADPWLNLREGPGTEYKKVGKLYPGEKADLLEFSNVKAPQVWVRVGVKQWCAMAYPEKGVLVEYGRYLTD